VTQPAGLSRRRRCGSGRQTRAGLLRRKRSLVRRLPRGGVGELVVLGDCVRLAGQKARVWWLRRHRHVEQLPIVRGMRLQAWLNWQIRYAGRELTTTQLRQFSDLFGDDAIGVYDDGWRDPRQGAPTGVTLISDGSSHSETTWTTPSRSRARNDPRPDRSTAVPPLNDFPCPCQAIRSLELTSCRSARLVRWLLRSGDQPGLRWIQASGSTPWTP